MISLAENSGKVQAQPLHSAVELFYLFYIDCLAIVCYNVVCDDSIGYV